MIETDARVVSTLASVEKRLKLPVSKMVRESLDLLRGAPAPKPRSAELIAARALLTNSRSKLVETRVILLQELALMKGAREELTSYVVAKYTNYLASVKNQQTRDALVGRALAPLSKRIRSLESAVEAVNAIIADFDSKAYGIRDTIAAIQLGEREA